MGDSTVAVLAGSKRSYQTAMEDDELISLQTKLFHDPEYSDLTIKCGKKIWRCHRAILCQRCQFFRAACGGSFIEAQTREIDLSEDHPVGVDAMLLFLYTTKFPEHKDKTRVSLSFPRQVAIIADKYCLATLRDHAITELITVIKPNISNWLRKDDHVVVVIGIEKVRQIWQVELECFASIRAVLLEELASAVGHISERAEFQELLVDNKDLSLELIKVLGKRANSVTTP